jgi:hypothetical protein
LAEDWTDCKAPVIEGITFYCKYLGSTLIEEPSSQTLTADAIKRIIAMVCVHFNQLFIHLLIILKNIFFNKTFFR